MPLLRQRPARPKKRAPLASRLLFAVLVGVLTALLVHTGSVAYAIYRESYRTTPVYDPPVLAGQMIPAGCGAGFYARIGDQIIITASSHCITEGATLRDGAGRIVGTYGLRARSATCPEGRFCEPSDMTPLFLAPDRISWGHLNEVDMGAGGYRVIAPGTAPLSCADLRAGDRVEIDGRGLFRQGKLLLTEPYDFSTDVIFPCMAIADITPGVGDSGGAVLVNGLPAGITARNISGYLGFTPLAEGLEALGATLCTDPDCGLTPPR